MLENSISYKEKVKAIYPDATCRQGIIEDNLQNYWCVWTEDPSVNHYGFLGSDSSEVRAWQATFYNLVDEGKIK